MSTHRFGTIERLAFDIDVEPDEHLRGVAFLALWAGGTRMGATDRAEILSTFLGSLARFIEALPPAPPELAALPSAAAFEAVHALATDPDPGRPDFPWVRSALYQRLLLLPNNCAPYDGDWAVVLREPARDRVIVRPYDDPCMREAVLGVGEVEATARAVLRYPWVA